MHHVFEPLFLITLYTLGGFCAPLLAQINSDSLFRYQPDQQGETPIYRSSIHVTATQPDGTPIPNVGIFLVRGEPTGHGGQGSQQLKGGRTDASGRVRFPGYLDGVPNLAALSDRAFDEQSLFLRLEGAGRHPITRAIQPEEWRSGKIHFQTPPLGFIEVQTTGLSVRAEQRVLIQPTQPVAQQPNWRPVSLSSGVARVVCRLDEEMELILVGGRSLTAIHKTFAGPTRIGETVRIGPLEPQNHISIRLGTDLLPKDLISSDKPGERSYLTVQLQGFPSRGPLGRAFISATEMQADGTFELFIPQVMEDNVKIAILVHFRQQGQWVAQGLMHGRFGEDQIIHVPLFEVGHFAAALRKVPFQPNQAQPLVVQGRVVDSENNPVPRAMVQIHEDASFAYTEQWRLPLGVPHEGIPCDIDGRFAFRSKTESTKFRMMASAGRLRMRSPIEFDRNTRELEISVLSLPEDGPSQPSQPFYANIKAPPYVAPNTMVFLARHADGTPVVRRPLRLRWIVPEESSNGHRPRRSPVAQHPSAHTDLLGRLLVPCPQPTLPGQRLEITTTDGAKPVLHAEFPWEVSGKTQEIVLKALSPSIRGTLRNQEGAPIPNTKLHLHVVTVGRRGTTRSRGPISEVHTETDGSFEFTGLPQESNFTIEAANPQHLRLLESGPYRRGNTKIALAGIGLGGLHIDYRLPPLVSPRAVTTTIFQQGRPLTGNHPQLRGNRLTFHRLEPGVYEVRVSLEWRQATKHGARKDLSPSLYCSGSIRVQPSQEAEYPVAPLVDLIREFRALPVQGELLGHRIRMSASEVGIRPNSEDDSLSWALASDPKTQDLLLLLPPNQTLQVAMRGNVSLRDRSTTLALVSDPVPVGRTQQEIVLPLKPAPVRRASVPAEVLAAITPFELWAVLHPSSLSNPSPWTALREPRLRLKTETIPFSTTGTIELPGVPCFPGDPRPAKLQLALVYQPENYSGKLHNQLIRGLSSTRQWATAHSPQSGEWGSAEGNAKFPWIEFVPVPDSPQATQPNGLSASIRSRRNPRQVIPLDWNSSHPLSVSPASLQQALLGMRAHLAPE